MADEGLADALVAHYEHNRVLIETFGGQLLLALDSAPALQPYIHSVKSRYKDPSHLRNKLLRKMGQADDDGTEFAINSDNLFTEINDLVGVRILHLYTRQIAGIDNALRSVFDEQSYELVEGPFARTWDDESREFFQECGIEVQPSPTLYTSVHYVISSASRTRMTCEIQVRTLSEEVWGEVDHTINYPVPTGSLACAEQLKVLARVTSSATRLVDAIFLTHADASADDGNDPDDGDDAGLT